MNKIVNNNKKKKKLPAVFEYNFIKFVEILSCTYLLNESHSRLLTSNVIIKIRIDSTCFKNMLETKRFKKEATQSQGNQQSRSKLESHSTSNTFAITLSWKIAKTRLTHKSA